MTTTSCPDAAQCRLEGLFPQYLSPHTSRIISLDISWCVFVILSYLKHVLLLNLA